MPTRLDCFTLTALAALAGLAAASPAMAHPHQFIDVGLEIVFNEAGQVAGLNQAWTFDEPSTRDLVSFADADKNGTTTADELTALARTTVTNLAGVSYYTAGVIGGMPLLFAPATLRAGELVDGRFRISFDLTLLSATAPGPGSSFEIADGSLYFGHLVDPAELTLNGAPAGCAASLAPETSGRVELICR